MTSDSNPSDAGLLKRASNKPTAKPLSLEHNSDEPVFNGGSTQNSNGSQQKMGNDNPHV